MLWKPVDPVLRRWIQDLTPKVVMTPTVYRPKATSDVVCTDTISLNSVEHKG